MLYDAQSARMLIGCLLNNPQILNNDKYNLSKEDFEPVEFHLRLYQVISFLAHHGAKQIDSIDVYNTAEKYQNIIEIFNENNCKDFITTIKQLSSQDNIELYYNNVKRMSLLRKYDKLGYDISRFYDVDNDKDLSAGKSVDEIIEYYEGQLVKIKKEFYKNSNIEEIKAGDGFEDVKAQFMKEPMYGASSFSLYANTATRGWVDKQLTIYSIPSGVGKTTIGLYNLVKVCCPEIWDYDSKQYVINKCCEHQGGLYIQYEMDSQYEVTPKIIASISGVPTFHILNGQYDKGESERVDKAIEILKQSNIYLVTMPSFTVGLIENYVKDYVINHNVKFCIFDYVSEQASVSSDIAKQNGVQTRSDQVLSTIASKLKDIAVECKVAIMTFTQTNANANNQEYMDAGCVAGSRSVQNKADIAGVIMPLRKSEEEVCDMMMQSKFPNSEMRPNRILHLYKMRFSSEQQGIKIWFNLNLNTGYVTDFFVTDKYNKPYEMDKTRLEINEE